MWLILVHLKVFFECLLKSEKSVVFCLLSVLFAVARPIAGGAGQVLRAGQERATAPHAAVPRLVSTRQLCKFLSLQVVTTLLFFPSPSDPWRRANEWNRWDELLNFYPVALITVIFHPTWKSLTVMFIICPHLMMRTLRLKKKNVFNTPLPSSVQFWHVCACRRSSIFLVGLSKLTRLSSKQPQRNLVKMSRCSKSAGK